MNRGKLLAIALVASGACGGSPFEEAGSPPDGGGAGAIVYGESGAGGASGASSPAGSGGGGAGSASGAGGRGGGGAGGASGAGGRGGVGGGAGSASAGSGGTAAAALPEYLIYGFVLGKPADCPEGYDTFDDTIAYYTRVTTGKASVVREELKKQMMAEHPGQREYNTVDSSFYYPTASHAVAIRYTANESPWNCRPKVVTIGVGKTYDEALAKALENKADNFSKNAPYEELGHITWRPK